MPTLAEYLGVPDPRKSDEEQKPRKYSRQMIRDFCREILASDEYRASLVRRIFIDELPAAVEVLLYHYAHGKPVEKLEVKDTTASIEDLTAEQLEQRAMFLVECARKMRMSEEDPDSDDDSPAVPTVN